MAMFSGTCVGGPFHGRPLHHGEPVFLVAIDPARPSKAVGRSPTAPPTADIKFGRYAHDKTSEKEIWIWYPPS